MLVEGHWRRLTREAIVDVEAGSRAHLWRHGRKYGRTGSLLKRLRERPDGREQEPVDPPVPAERGADHVTRVDSDEPQVVLAVPPPVSLECEHQAEEFAVVVGVS